MVKRYALHTKRPILIAGQTLTPEDDLVTIELQCDLPIRKVLQLLQFNHAELLEIDAEEVEGEELETIELAPTHGPGADATDPIAPNPEPEAAASEPVAEAEPDNSGDNSGDDSDEPTVFDHYPEPTRRGLAKVGIVTLADAAEHYTTHKSFELLDGVGRETNKKIIAQLQAAGLIT